MYTSYIGSNQNHRQCLRIALSIKWGFGCLTFTFYANDIKPTTPSYQMHFSKFNT